MNTITTLALAGALALGASTASAQDAGADVDVDAAVEASQEGVDTAPAEASGEEEINASGNAQGAMEGDAGQPGADSAGGDALQAGEAAGLDVYGAYGALTSAIGTASGDIDLSNVTDQSTIRFVTLSELEASDDTAAQALDDAVAENEDAIATLRDTLSGNDVVSAAIEDNGYAVEDVVNATLEQDASITLYVDDRA